MLRPEQQMSYLRCNQHKEHLLSHMLMEHLLYQHAG